MSHPDISASYLDPFRGFASDDHLTILLGAGASVPSGLPTWEQLAVRLAVKSGLVESVESAELLLRAPGQDLSFVMQAVKDIAGESWPGMLIDELEDSTGPSELHLAAVAHYLADPSKTTLATLNYDVLLERALWSELHRTGDEGVEVHVFESNSVEPGQIGVYHLHGHAYRLSSGSIVAGFDDYSTLMAAREPWQKQFLESSLRKGNLLLVGTSYNDPDIRHWLHQALKQPRNRNKVMVIIAREGMRIGARGDSISKAAFTGLRRALDAEWQSIGIRPILVDDYSDAAQVIAELRKLGQSGYRTPQEIAAEVWAVHARNLRRLQPEYEERLRANARALKESLNGAPVHRPTLWLSDGEGLLWRWASKGSHYTEVQEMKRVPTGHDSDWIAGESLSSTWFKTKAVQLDKKSRPSWKSIIAVPVQVSQINTAVITFGIDRTEAHVLSTSEWHEIAGRIGDEWGKALEQTLVEESDWR